MLFRFCPVAKTIHWPFFIAFSQAGGLTQLMAFAGEPFLQVALPRYEEERSRLTMLLFGASIFWIVIFPLFFAVKPTEKVLDETQTGTVISETKRKRSKTSKKKDDSSRIQQQTPESAAPEIPLSATVYSVVGLIFTVLGLFMTQSPHNYFTSRRVFQAPLFTAEECDRVVAMAQAAAQRNYETAQSSSQQQAPRAGDETTEQAHAIYKANQTRHALLEEPTGWQKTRHNSYPT